MTSATSRFIVEDRAQSCGAEITSRQDQLHRVRVRAHHMPAPSDLALRICQIELKARGLSLSPAQADDLLRLLTAAQAIGQEHQP